MSFSILQYVLAEWLGEYDIVTCKQHNIDSSAGSPATALQLEVHQPVPPLQAPSSPNLAGSDNAQKRSNREHQKGFRQRQKVYQLAAKVY